MPVSRAQQEATARYEAKVYDKVLVRLPKGHKAEIQAHAEARGESVNGFIGRAIDETMERETPLLASETRQGGVAHGITSTERPIYFC